MKHALLLAAVGLVSSLVGARPAHAEPKPYSMADLKALVEQKSYAEAVAHLADVAPSERKGEWTTIAVDAASGLLASLTGDETVRAASAIEDLDTRFPTLMKNATYAKQRGKAGLAAYKACFDGVNSSYGYYYRERQGTTLDDCFSSATKFVDATPDNAELALAMAKLMRPAASAYSSAPMFKRAVFAAGKHAAAVCKDDDLELSIVAALGLPPDYEEAAAARNTAEKCFDALKKPMLGAFEEEGSYFRANACPLLLNKRALNGEQAKLCTAKD
jgi:hypothetical protein